MSIEGNKKTTKYQGGEATGVMCRTKKPTPKNPAKNEALRRGHRKTRGTSQNKGGAAYVGPDFKGNGTKQQHNNETQKDLNKRGRR